VISFASALNDEWYRIETPDTWVVEQGIRADGSTLADQGAERIAGSLFVNASDPEGQLNPTDYRVSAGRRDGLSSSADTTVNSGSTAASGTEISGLYGSLRVGLGNPLLTWGEPTSPVVSTETLFDKQVGTSYAFANPFLVGANQVIAITGVGGDRDSSSTEVLLSQLVVRAFPAEPPTGVPGPLPLAGALAAFGWSRRLRGRLSRRGAPYSRK
jgi:hypothetical protein